MKITWINYYHNGDIHVSRGFVRQIMNKVHQIDPTIQFAYGHRNNPTLLSDIPNLGIDNTALSIVRDNHTNLYRSGDRIYINTWYGQQHYKYMNRYGLTMDCLYASLDDTCKQLWNFSLSELTNDFSTFFPIIDYSKFDLERTKKWLSKHPQKKIFIANGLALSDQATNFAMTPIIADLAGQFYNQDKIFILTNVEKKHQQLPHNVIYSSSIINTKKIFNLNENSFLSTHCDVIVGRNSGASTFAMTQENLFQLKKKILLFTNIVPHHTNKFWTNEIFKDKIDYSSDIVCSNENNVAVISNIIDKTINMG